MYTPITAIYLDVDEVLVDWVGAALRVLGFDPDAIREHWDSLDPRPWNLFDVIDYDVRLAWMLIDEQGPEFWATLRPFPWAFDLLGACREVAPVTLLTSPSMHPNSRQGAVDASPFWRGLPRLRLYPRQASLRARGRRADRRLAEELQGVRGRGWSCCAVPRRR